MNKYFPLDKTNHGKGNSYQGVNLGLLREVVIDPWVNCLDIVLCGCAAQLVDLTWNNMSTAPLRRMGSGWGSGTYKTSHNEVGVEKSVFPIFTKMQSK